MLSVVQLNQEYTWLNVKRYRSIGLWILKITRARSLLSVLKIRDVIMTSLLIHESEMDMLLKLICDI